MSSATGTTTIDILGTNATGDAGITLLCIAFSPISTRETRGKRHCAVAASTVDEQPGLETGSRRRKSSTAADRSARVTSAAGGTEETRQTLRAAVLRREVPAIRGISWRTKGSASSAGKGRLEEQIRAEQSRAHCAPTSV